MFLYSIYLSIVTHKIGLEFSGQMFRRQPHILSLAHILASGGHRTTWLARQPIGVDMLPRCGACYRSASATSAAEGFDPESALPTRDFYMRKTLQELHELIGRRDEQISDLRSLHERVHRNAEYLHRMQQLDREEKAVYLGTVAGRMQMDTLNFQRFRLEQLRKEHDVSEREKGLFRWMLFFLTVGLGIWLPRHYVYIPGQEEKAPIGASNRIAGPAIWASNSSLTARSRETAFDVEVREAKEAKKAAAASKKADGQEAAK